MKKIEKTYPAPSILTKATVISETKFDSSIYGDKTVKDQLFKDQHGKCAYCECKILGEYGDVEHYRPKAAYTAIDGKTYKPGYFNLTYSWDNLLLSCSKCNRTYKKNHFPLKDESKRANLNQNISKEEPLLINPYFEDPNNHFVFNEYMAQPIMVNGEEDCAGRCTIDIMGLNTRKDLVEKRRERWTLFCSLCKVIVYLQKENPSEQSGDILNELIRDVELLKSEDSEFLGMIINQK